MRLDIHVHHDAAPEVLAALAEISRKMDLAISKQEATMAELADLQAQVASNTTVIESAITLINGIAARIAAAGTDPVALKALTDSLKSEDDALSAAVASNTPAAV